MKFGDSGSSVSFDGNGKPELVFRYWVLPDRPQKSSTRFGIDIDFDAATRQTEQIRKYLENAFESGTWTIRNDRIYFVKEEDWEVFKTMCLIGWA